MSRLIGLWQKGHAVDWATVQQVDGSLFFVGNKAWNSPSRVVAAPYQLYRLKQTTSGTAQAPMRVGPVLQDYTDWKVDAASAADTCLRVLQFGKLWASCPPAPAASLRPANDYGVLPMFDDFGLAAVDSSGTQLYWQPGGRPLLRPAAGLPTGTKIRQLNKVNQAGLVVLWLIKNDLAARDDSMQWVYDAKRSRFVNQERNRRVVFLRPDLLKLQLVTDSSWQFVRLDSATRTLMPMPGPASFRAVEALDATTVPAAAACRYATVGADGTLHWYREKPGDPDTLRLADRRISAHRWLPGGQQALVRTPSGWQVCRLAKIKKKTRLLLDSTAFQALRLWPLTANWILCKKDSSSSNLVIHNLQGTRSLSTTIAASADSLLITSLLITSNLAGDTARVCWREPAGKLSQLYFQFFRCSPAGVKAIGPKHAASQLFAFRSVLIAYGAGPPAGADSAQVWHWAVPYRRQGYALEATRPIELPAGSGTYYWPGHRQQAARSLACLLELARSGQLHEYTQLAAPLPAAALTASSPPAAPAPARQRRLPARRPATSPTRRR